MKDYTHHHSQLEITVGFTRPAGVLALEIALGLVPVASQQIPKSVKGYETDKKAVEQWSRVKGGEPDCQGSDPTGCRRATFLTSACLNLHKLGVTAAVNSH